MRYTERDYRKLVESCYPADFRAAILKGFVTAYRVAPDHCKRHFDQPDRHDILGMTRRGRIHQEVRGVAVRYQIDARDPANSKGSSYYLILTSGRLHLIVCATASPRTRIRRAKFREMLAIFNRDGQQNLDFMPTDAEPPVGCQFLSVLIHGPRRGRRDQPGFVDLVIPNKHLTGYICRLSLFKEFPNIAQEMLQRPTRVSPKKPYLRKRTGEATGE